MDLDEDLPVNPINSKIHQRVAGERINILQHFRHQNQVTINVMKITLIWIIRF
jgi:hypothetical protein